MTTTLFIGIDVSSRANSACLMSDNGSIVNSFSFNNDLAGAEIFVNLMLHHLKQGAFKKLMIATEAASFYDFHLVDFLATNVQLAIYKPEIYRFNPRIVNSFKKGCYSDIQKTDSIDAVAIADRLRFGRLPLLIKLLYAHNFEKTVSKR